MAKWVRGGRANGGTRPSHGFVDGRGSVNGRLESGGGRALPAAWLLLLLRTGHMSTGKRLAKRSIPGTRVCAPLEDGSYVPGVIQACLADADDVYCVLLDDDSRRQYGAGQLIGPGFRSVSEAVLKTGQKVFLTHEAREVEGLVVGRPGRGDLLVSLHGRPHVRLTKRTDQVRLLRSRKSARLQDLDTDYWRLAEGQAEPRRRASSLSIDVPGGRKRRSAREDHVMDDCTAAMVLMSLSCSPRSNSGSRSGRSPTGSPPSPERESSDRSSPARDEGIELDDAEDKVTAKVVFQCTWPGCARRYASCRDVERHVCVTHLGRSEAGDADREEEFYYTEVEVEGRGSPSPPATGATIYSSSVPTLSHLDMARPPHEDPEYRRLLGTHPTRPERGSVPVDIPSASGTAHGCAASAPTGTGSSPHKFLRLASRGGWPAGRNSPHHRKGRSESRKCRKVYGMDNREAWCTQCKWKKACSRFVD